MQVAQELADCISLPDGTIAQLSVARSLAKADSVIIEPYGEDDWEILESRAELAEETILKQVVFGSEKGNNQLVLFLCSLSC